MTPVLSLGLHSNGVSSKVFVLSHALSFVLLRPDPLAALPYLFVCWFTICLTSLEAP